MRQRIFFREFLIAVVLLAWFLIFPAETRANSPMSIDASAKSTAHYLMGVLYDWDDKTTQAIVEYLQALKTDPGSYAIRLRLGADYLKLNKMEDAVAQLKEAVVLNPADLQAHYLLSLVYATQKDFDKASLEYEAILSGLSKNDPANTEIYGYLAQLYYSQKDYAKAEAQFHKILELEPKNVEALYLLGSLYLEMEQRAKATATFKTALDVDPMHDGILNSLAYVYAEDGVNLDEALMLLQKALELSPDNGAYLDSLGWVYYKKGMYREALEYLQKAIAIFEDPIIYDHLGDTYLKLGQMAEARKSWEASLKLSPDQTEVAKKLQTAGDPPSAVQK